MRQLNIALRAEMQTPRQKNWSREVDLPEVLVRSGYGNLDVLPADLSYRNFDVHLSERKHPTERLLRMSRSLRDAYATLMPGLSTGYFAAVRERAARGGCTGR